MGLKEDYIRFTTLEQLNDVMPTIKSLLIDLVHLVDKSNCYMVFKRRLYRKIRELSNHKAIQIEIPDPYVEYQNYLIEMRNQYIMIPKVHQEKEWNKQNAIPWDDSMMKSQIVNNE